MERLTLKFINFSSDFKNESLINRSNKLFKDIRTKNVVGFENFGFHELALNFNEDNALELDLFSKKIHDKNIRTIFVFCNSADIMNYNAGYTYLFKNDILKESKIKYIFVNNDEPYLWDKIYQQNEQLIKNLTTGFLFIGQECYSEAFINFIKLILNDIQQDFGYYRALERCFLIGKRILELQLGFMQLAEDHKLIMPEILTNNYLFFAESNLFLLLLKGCDLLSLLEGYQSAARLWNSENLEENYAFQYAFVKHLQRKNYQFDFISGDNPILTNSLVLQANMENLLFGHENRFATTLIFPNAIYTYGQYIIDNAKQIYLTHYEVLYEQMDYRLSDELNSKDGLEKFANITLSEFQKNANDGIINTVRDIANINGCIILLADNSAFTLGTLICFIYWVAIYEAYLNKQNPFDFVL
ncbi:glucose-6-phosphate isomerase [Mycoplasmopsis adleri]|uniref:glucose-6-phosphate isomerase n=1 Tax=Mycoplasmopsis adleri TaxID=51362 RepID=UPI003873236E